MYPLAPLSKTTINSFHLTTDRSIVYINNHIVPDRQPIAFLTVRFRRFRLLAVDTPLPHMHVIDDPDYDGVHRKILCFRSKSGTGPLHNEDHFSFARTHRVHRDKGSAGGHECAPRLRIHTIGFHEKEFSPHHRVHLLRGYQ
jgi:hypothetical protein